LGPRRGRDYSRFEGAGKRSGSGPGAGRSCWTLDDLVSRPPRASGRFTNVSPFVAQRFAPARKASRCKLAVRPHIGALFDIVKRDFARPVGAGFRQGFGWSFRSSSDPFAPGLQGTDCST